MGWYVNCCYCHRIEKARHPDCDCRQKHLLLLQQQLIGATVVELFNLETQHASSVCMKYNKNNELIHVKIITKDRGDDEYHYFESMYQITEDDYRSQKLQSIGLDKHDVSNLFLLSFLLQHQDLLFYIITMMIELNDIDIDEVIENQMMLLGNY